MARLLDRFGARVALALVALAALIAVVAFATQPAQRDDDQVRNVLTDFVTAALNRDGDGACSHLTARAQRAVTAAVPGTTCPAYVRSFGLVVAALGAVTLHLPHDLGRVVVLDRTNITGPDGRPVQRRVVLVRGADGEYRIDAV